MRYCVECKGLQDTSKFNTRRVRNVCIEHFNKKQIEMKNKKWSKNPMERKAHTVWQIAYVDCRKTFQVKMEMRPSQVQEVLERNQVGAEESVRLIPADPERALSASNFCLVDAATKSDMCFVWRRLKDVKEYRMCFDPRCSNKIYCVVV
jgi:hypothetical protein